jgi:NDP-sugar pyrophosphorylase family protein
LTYDTPKPLLDFCGEPFLLGVLRRLAEAGVARVLLVVGAVTEPFDRLRAPAAQLGLDLVSVPEPEPLDTAGGVRSVLDQLGDRFLVLNGDILTDVDLASVAAAHARAGADATMVLTCVEDTSSFGVAVRDATRVSRFVEKPPPGSLPGQDAINAGTYLLEAHVLAAHPEGSLSFERDVFPGLIERGGHLEGFVWEGVWADLGTPRRYRDGHRLALDGELRWPSVTRVPERAPGIRIADDAEVADDATLHAPVLILEQARIGAGAVVGPGTVIGRGCDVGEHVRLGSCILHEDVHIGAEVVADGLIAGRGCRIDSGARLGTDVVLGSGRSVAADERLADGERRPPPAG